MLKYFQTASDNIKMQSIITFISIVTSTLTFFLLSCFLSFALLSNYLLNFLESKAQITVYFQDTATEEHILDTKKKLVELDFVTDVAYTSKEEALNIFLDLYETEPLLVESVDVGIFPASLDVRVRDIADLDKTSEVLKEVDHIEEISYFKEALDQFKSWSNGIKYVGSVLVSALLLISFLVILLVTGITIRDRSEEIRIMKLLGATDSYIQGPFFAQTVLISLISSLFSVIMFMGLLPFVEPFVRQQFSTIPIPPVGFLTVLYIFAIQFAVNLFISFSGTLVAVKKYMNL